MWNLMGVFQYLAVAYMTDEMAAEMPADQQAYYADMPAWVTAAFAIAVFGGDFGSIFLLFRKKLAESVLVVSFVSVLVQMTYNLFIAESTVVYETGWW